MKRSLGESSRSVRGLGGSFITSSSGVSLPRPRAGSRSVPRSIARMRRTVSGSGSPKMTKAMNGIISGTLLVRMYCMNFLMLLKTVLPSSMAFTIVAKLSSRSTMSAASWATSVPESPIATPMSACFKAGASFTPSPVTATTSPID